MAFGLRVKSQLQGRLAHDCTPILAVRTSRRQRVCSTQQGRAGGGRLDAPGWRAATRPQPRAGGCGARTERIARGAPPSGRACRPTVCRAQRGVLDCGSLESRGSRRGVLLRRIGRGPAGWVRVPPPASHVAVGFQPSTRIAVQCADRVGRSPSDVSRARRTNGTQPDPTAEATVTPEVAAILRRAEQAGIDPRRVAVALGLPHTALAGLQSASGSPDNPTRRHASSGR